jgi:phage terminase large subunit-like protein
MDLYSASVYELRGELRRLQRTLNATPVSAMKRKDLIQHIEIYKKLADMLTVIPIPDVGSGRLPARHIPIDNIVIDDTDIAVPAKPKPRAFGKPKNSLPPE